MSPLLKKAVLITFILSFCMAISTMQLFAVTQSEINIAVEKGTVWLVNNQYFPDSNYGYWSNNHPVATTAFAILKLSDRAFELGYSSPFDSNYSYHENVEKALRSLFSTAGIVDFDPNVPQLSPGRPDSDTENGKGVYFGANYSYMTYETGIALMAITATRSPNRIVNSPGSVVNGWTYKQVVKDMVDYLAYGQNDPGSGWPEGGWGYYHNYGSADNSNSGYAVLGLGYASASKYGFNCTPPQFVKDTLNNWITYVQGSDGGSGYTAAGSWPNALKTGNLIFQMKFYGDDITSPRLQNALGYLCSVWSQSNQDPGWQGPPPHYQAAYCIMKGLEAANVLTLPCFSGGLDWFNDVATSIIANQQTDGSWSGDVYGDQALATLWALLTIEKSAPPIYRVEGQCIHNGESFSPVDLDDYLDPQYQIAPPYNWSVTGNVNLGVSLDSNNVLTVTYPPNWTGSETLTVTFQDQQNTLMSYPVFTVCPAQVTPPCLLDIPDQTYPFGSFDLDDYLDPQCRVTPDQVQWFHSTVPPGWSVSIDNANVVTVSGPTDINTSIPITFTAVSRLCPCDIVSGSDTATFTTFMQCNEGEGGYLDIKNLAIPFDLWEYYGQYYIVFPLRIQNAPNRVEAFGFEVTYDPGLLEYVENTRGPCIQNFDYFEVTQPEGPGMLRVGGFTSDPGDDTEAILPGASCDLVYLKFRILNCTYIGGGSSLIIRNLKDDINWWYATGGCFACVCSGDINKDGEITPMDALCAFQKYLEICPTRCGACEDVCCDVNHDGECTPEDALCIFQRYLGIQSCLDLYWDYEWTD